MRRLIALIPSIAFAACAGGKQASPIEIPKPQPETTAAAGCQESPSTAAEIRERMHCEYRSLTSYHDEGVVLSYWPSKPGPDRLLFETRFVRPGQFRFAYTSHHPYPPLRHITNTQTLWSDAGVTRLHWTAGPQIQTLSSIESGIQQLKGVSNLSSFFVPSLLLPIAGQTNGPASWKLETMDAIDGVPCYHLSQATGPTQMDLWIGASDFLLRKIVKKEKSTAKLPRRRTEYLYKVLAANEEIASSDFQFVPPPYQDRAPVKPTQPAPVAPSSIVSDAKARAKRESKVTVIDFGASWCEPCHYFDEHVAVGDEVLRALEDVVFVKVGCDTAATEPVCDQFEVAGYPTFVILNAEGLEIDRQSGLADLMRPSDFATFLHAAADSGLGEAEMVQKIEVNNADSQRKAGEWYLRHLDQEKAAEHFELAAGLDANDAQGIGAAAGWKALELRMGRSRVAQLTEQAVQFVERFPGSADATRALAIAALSHTLDSSTLAKLVATHSARLNDPEDLERTAFIALELGLTQQAVDISTLLAKHRNGGFHELRALLALAQGDEKTARGFYVLCVTETHSKQCEDILEIIESGTKGYKQRQLDLGIRSYFLNLKSPGGSGELARRELRLEEYQSRRPEPIEQLKVTDSRVGSVRQVHPVKKEEIAYSDTGRATRAIILARHESENLQRTMIGLRGFIGLRPEEQKLMPSLMVQAEAGRVGDNDLAFDGNVMIGPSVKTHSAFVGIFAGIGGSGAGASLRSAVHVPVEISLTIDNDEYEGDIWIRSRKLFGNGRQHGAENGPFDELAVGLGVQLFPSKAHGLMLGMLYEELQEQTSATIWIGTRLTKPGGGKL